MNKHYSEMTSKEWWEAHERAHIAREKERNRRQWEDIKSCFGCVLLIVFIALAILL